MKTKQVIVTSFLAVLLLVCTNARAAEEAMAPKVVVAAPAAMVAPMVAPMAALTMDADMAAPAAMVAPMAPVPAAMEPMAIATPVAPMEPVVAPPPVASEPVESVAPEKPMDATPVASATGMAATVATMDASPAQAAPKVSTDSKAVLWLGVITVGLLGLLGLLGGFGLLNWTKKERALKIMKIADKILDGLAVAAKATSFKWDDALVTMLHDIDTRLIASGEKGLADAEKDAVKKIAETRKDQVLTEPAKVEAKKD